MNIHLDCLCSASITFLLMSTINNALIYIEKHYFHPFQYRLVSQSLCKSYLQISENLKWSSDRTNFLPFEEALFFHFIILDRVDHFTGDRLTEQFNVALFLNPGEDSDIGVDVCKGSCAGMRGVTMQFHFLVQSFCKCFLQMFMYFTFTVSFFFKVLPPWQAFSVFFTFWGIVNLSFFFSGPIISISK